MPVKFRYIFFVVLSTFITKGLIGQDAPISQYYHNLFITNPAYAGTTQGARVSGFYRQQWIRVPGSFESYGISYDRFLPKYNSGFGIIVNNVTSGALTEPAIEFAYSYHINASRNLNISMGLQGGIVQKYLNQSEIDFKDDSEIISSGLNKIYPDFGLGLVVFYKTNLYGGFSIHHINRPISGSNGDASRINMRYTGQIGYVIELNKRLIKQTRILMPNMLIQIHGNQQNISWGAVYQHDYLLGGLLVRHNISTNIDALIFSAGFKTQKLRFAYSYDMNIGKRATMPLGSHEVSLTFLFDIKSKKKYKAIGCPSFLE